MLTLAFSALISLSVRYDRGPVVVVDAEPLRAAGMIEGDAAHGCGSDTPFGFFGASELEPRGNVVDADREMDVVEDVALKQLLRFVGQRVHEQVRVAAIQRREERQAQHVIPVGVGEQQVHRRRATALEQRVAERAHAGAGVEDQRRVVGKSHFDARRVAAVADRVGTGFRNRPARAPEANAHVLSPSQRPCAEDASPAAAAGP